MDTKTWLGSLSELKVATRLVELGYDVFTQMSGKSPFDLIAYKDGNLFRVSVKGTAYEKDGGYTVQLKSVRPNRTGNTIKKFDNTSCDILAVFIQPLDTVCFFKSDSITALNSLSIRKSSSKYSSNGGTIVGDYLTI